MAKRKLRKRKPIKLMSKNKSVLLFVASLAVLVVAVVLLVLTKS